MAANNISLLTRSHHVVNSKKRAKREQVKEVVFNEDARREFLTGFHKRKVAKQEAAKKKAIEREKQERREQRLEHRRALAERALSNAKEVEKAYGGGVDDGEDEWNGLDSETSEKEREEEYSDEEQTAHVTVVQEFDPSDIHGIGPSRRDSDSDSEEVEEHETVEEPRPPRRNPQQTHPPTASVKKKDPKKVKYQTAAARKAEERKQKRRKAEKADRARGKGHGKMKGKR